MRLFRISLESLPGEFCHGNEILFVGHIRRQLGLFFFSDDVTQGDASAAWQKAHMIFKCFGPVIPFVILGEEAQFGSCLDI